MRRIRMMGLCLVVVCSLAAVAVSSASAETLPKFNECVKVKGGKFEKGCAKEGGTGGYEKQEGFGKGRVFKGTGKALSFHVPKLKSEISCKATKDSGTVTGEKTEGEIIIILTGCVIEGKKCGSEGEQVGEIRTHDLKGELGYINAAKREVGADLAAEAGSAVMNFQCEGLVFETTGSLIGNVTPVNAFTKSTTLSHSVNGSGEQEIKHLEGQPNDVLFSTVGGQGPFESGIQNTEVNKGEELEIEA